MAEDRNLEVEEGHNLAGVADSLGVVLDKERSVVDNLAQGLDTVHSDTFPVRQIQLLGDPHLGMVAPENHETI